MLRGGRVREGQGGHGSGGDVLRHHLGGDREGVQRGVRGRRGLRRRTVVLLGRVRGRGRRRKRGGGRRRRQQRHGGTRGGG